MSCDLRWTKRNRPLRSLWLRRVVATGLDDAMIMAPLAAVAATNVLWHRADGRTFGGRPPWLRGVVPVVLTLPFSVALGCVEDRAGTPGKRVMGLRAVGVEGAVSLPRHLIRSCVKTAVPWELGHQSVWEFTADHPRRGIALSVAAYALITSHVLGMVRGSGRTPADWAAGTVVRDRERLTDTVHVSQR
ncbi:MAG: RDD family protein [Ornithinimicrobium sp.]